MEEGWKQGFTLCTPDSVPNMSSIKHTKPRCVEHMVYSQEDRTTCQKQEDWKRYNAKHNKEIMKKGGIAINARNSFVYNSGAKGWLT